MNMDSVLTNLGHNLIAVAVYTIVGLVLFIGAFMVFDRITPGTLWKEILEEHNTALAILMGFIAVALAIIIAAAIV
jgi:putative membrane protein